MKIWLAFTDFESAEKALAYPIQGILTNPTLISLPELLWRETVKKLNTIGKLPIGLQVVSTNEQEMIEEISEFHKLIDRKELIIKLPFCLSTLKLAPYIKNMRHRINIAAVCTYNQAVYALETDPEYLSIYVGRVDDSGGDGAGLVERVKKYAIGCGKTSVIQAASIRTAQQLTDVAEAGADAAVITFELLQGAMKSEITDESIHAFKKDWEKVS
jgi:TalC/MipB family fructose-6-phosphate aldolase